jgi:hypothetical protein
VAFSIVLCLDIRGSLGRGLSLDGQQMLQKLILESSERFSRSSKKKTIKGTFRISFMFECKRELVFGNFIHRFVWRAAVSRG